MTEAQSDLDFALNMYGQCVVKFASSAAKNAVESSTDYDNMVFWQNQVWHCAKAVAEENV